MSLRHFSEATEASTSQASYSASVRTTDNYEEEDWDAITIE